MPAATSALETLARAAFMLLAACLPFELVAPLARVGPLALTSVEIALYVALATGAAALAAGALSVPGGVGLALRRLTALDVAVGVFAVVLLVSAARAPFLRGAAFKFALRTMGGMSVFFVAARVLRRRGAVLAVAGCLTIGAVAAALLLVWDRHAPADALTAFHFDFDVFGLPRASGPFQYPNIAAMYLEAMVPVALVVGAAIDARRGSGHRFAIAAAVTALLLGQGVSLTESRAGVMTVGIVLASMAVLAGRPRPTVRRQAVAVLAGLTILAVAGSSLSGLRFKFWLDRAWYKSAIRLGPPGLPSTLTAGELATIPVEVRNLGARPWPASGPQPVRLSYHWREVPTGRTVVFDGLRTPLPSDVAPDAAARLAAGVRAPARPGRYRLQLDLVHEQVTWFSQRGDSGYEATIVVVADTAERRRQRAEDDADADAEAAASRAAAETVTHEMSRRRLWRAAIAAFRDHPLLGLGPDNFRHAYSRYMGLAEGAPFDDRLHANNWFFETLATLGLAGLAALVVVVWLVWRSARRALTRHEGSSPEGLLAFGLAAGLAAYLIHGLCDYFLEFTPTYGLVWLLAGLLAAIADGPGTFAGSRTIAWGGDELRSSSPIAGGAGPSQGPEQESHEPG